MASKVGIATARRAAHHALLGWNPAAFHANLSGSANPAWLDWRPLG